MKNFILILALLSLSRINIAQVYAANTTACDQTTQFYYNNGCVTRGCLADKLSKMQMTIGFGNEKVGNVGVLGQGFTYQILPMNGSAGTYFTVNIRYADNSTNQILSDPMGCINYHIYSTVNSYSQNPARQAPSIVGVVTDGFTPSWPLSQYTYDPQIGAALSFNMTVPQMAQYCLTLNATGGNIEYDCFFEVAFQVRGTTQASYYFETQVFLNTVTNQVPTTNFVQQTQVATCQPNNGNQCVTNITIASTFQFCDNYACQNPQNFPIVTLFVNRVFYMKFAISDLGLSQLFIRNPQISYNGFQLQMVNTANQLTFNNINPGYIIFNLTVPIVSTNVQISVTGQLSPSKSRRMMSTAYNSSASYVSTSTASSGAIVDANSTTIPINSSPSSSSTKSSISSSNALMMAVFLSATILFV